jgi:hypothetical protein
MDSDIIEDLKSIKSLYVIAAFSTPKDSCARFSASFRKGYSFAFCALICRGSISSAVS